MTGETETNRAQAPAKDQGFASYWWLNVARGTAALMMGIGLLLPYEVIIQADQLHGILFQFVGIYFLLSGVMSLIWGFSNRRRLGLWILAGILGLVGGVAFIFEESLQRYFAADVLAILFGLIMMLAGMIHILGGFKLGDVYGRHWTFAHTFLGLVEVAAGILVVASLFIPVDNLRFMLSFWGIVAGGGMIAEGVQMRRSQQSVED